MFRLPLSFLSPAGAKGRLSILIFHRVLAAPDALMPDEPDVVQFEAQLRWVRDWFNVISLKDATDRLFAGTIPERALCVTFDDGYADNEELAAPILHRLGLTATFFVSTGYLTGGCMWNDRITAAVRACPTGQIDVEALGLGRHAVGSIGERARAIDALIKVVRRLEGSQRQDAVDDIVAACGSPTLPSLMMRPEQVRSLRRWGMDVGAHTISHPILTRIGLEAARNEIGGSKEELEAILGERIDLFAYPNGVPHLDYGTEHVRLVRECGFKAAVATAWGAASGTSDPHQLPRFTPWDRSRLRYGVRLLGNFRRVPEKVA